jgi:hypothetical protein
MPTNKTLALLLPAAAIGFAVSACHVRVGSGANDPQSAQPTNTPPPSTEPAPAEQGTPRMPAPRRPGGPTVPPPDQDAGA